MKWAVPLFLLATLACSLYLMPPTHVRVSRGRESLTNVVAYTDCGEGEAFVSVSSGDRATVYAPAGPIFSSGDYFVIPLTVRGERSGEDTVTVSVVYNGADGSASATSSFDVTVGSGGGGGAAELIVEETECRKARRGETVYFNITVKGSGVYEVISESEDLSVYPASQYVDVDGTTSVIVRAKIPRDAEYGRHAVYISLREEGSANVVARTAACVEVPEKADADVWVEPAVLEVDRTGEYTAKLYVKNMGDEEKTFSITVYGNATVSRNTLRLEPRETGSVEVTVFVDEPGTETVRFSVKGSVSRSASLVVRYKPKEPILIQVPSELTLAPGVNVVDVVITNSTPDDMEVEVYGEGFPQGIVVYPDRKYVPAESSRAYRLIINAQNSIQYDTVARICVKVDQETRCEYTVLKGAGIKAMAAETMKARVSQTGNYTYKLTLTNTTGRRLENITLDIKTPDGWYYSLDPAGPYSLAPGESREIKVTFTPTSDAEDGEATIEVYSGNTKIGEKRVRVSKTGGVTGLAVLASPVNLLILIIAVLIAVYIVWKVGGSGEPEEPAKPQEKPEEPKEEVAGEVVVYRKTRS